ncbi:MAG: glucosyltransferase domain-containing protein [Oscillospiraceae bacterium]|nr:glucosyltransferase domain-containing protein [Oscillospiraceae bacterium]MBR7010261.1 glucosyltransferase domain-containing protein [Oscillospiraceae bacterium]
MEEKTTLRSRWRMLPPAVRAACLCCFAAGFFCHLFAITNLIPNSDGVSRVYDAQQMTVSGRWFLHYASAWNGYLQAPAVIGFFALLFLSLAAGLTASVLKLRRPLSGALCGALMAAFPSVAYTFLYLFTASAYCFGILLAVLAVWLADRYRWGFLFAAPVLACALGTYQAYLAVAVSLLLLRLVLLGLSEGEQAKHLLLEGLKSLALLVLGLLLYYLTLRIFLAVKDLELLNYKGIGGGLSLSGMLAKLPDAYLGLFRYFFVPHSFAKYTTPLTVAGNTVMFLAGLWAILRLPLRSRPRPGTVALTLHCCALLPLGLNLTVLMGDPMPIMRFALVFAWILPLALTDRACPARKPEEAARGRRSPDRRQMLRRLPRAAALCGAILLCLVSFNIDNLAYTVSATSHRATESFATRLVDRVESTPGYQKDMEVVIVGGFPQKVYYSQIEAFALVSDYSNRSTTVIPLNKHVYYYLNDWLNVPWPEPSEETMMTVSESPAFQNMPLYPSDGSIVIRDGRVIVKLAERYTPKKDYEIAYENRR